MCMYMYVQYRPVSWSYDGIGRLNKNRPNVLHMAFAYRSTCTCSTRLYTGTNKVVHTKRSEINICNIKLNVYCHVMCLVHKSVVLLCPHHCDDFAAKKKNK